MNILFTVTSILFFPWIFRSILFWISLWQQNGYRTDRILVFINERRNKRTSLFIFVYLFKWFLFLGYIFIIFNDNFYFVYQLLITILYITQAYILSKEVYNINLNKYKITVRSVVITLISLITIVTLYILPLLDRFFWLLLLDIIIPLLVSFLVFIFSFPVELYSDWLVEKAAKKIQDYPNLIVIAVSGSQGKSLTKDYISAILANRFKVIKTKGKAHNELDIAKTIQTKLQYDTEIFITELTAYKREEITSLCKILHPLIGVITTINETNLQVAGNMKNIRIMNFELVESLPKNGICLFNGNNMNAYNLYKKTKITKCLYVISNDTNIEAGKNNIIVLNTIKKASYISFDVQVMNSTIHFTFHSHTNLEFILPGIMIGKFLGMSNEELKKAVSDLK